MIIMYSGQRSKVIAPEELLKRHIGFMLTYSDFYKRKSSESIRRFKAHKERIKKHEARKRKS